MVQSTSIIEPRNLSKDTFNKEKRFKAEFVGDLPIELNTKYANNSIDDPDRIDERLAQLQLYLQNTLD
jgi:hypothetical protein